MTCCPNCFADIEIQSIIRDISQGTGQCDCCHSGNVPIVDIEELSDNFAPLLDLYEVTDEQNADTLSTIIQKEWGSLQTMNLQKIY